MATVAGVRFKKAGKVYYFDPTDVWPKPGDPVIVETIRGVELGETATGAREVPDETLVAPLKKILRIASPEDVKRAEECEAKEREAMRICQEKIAAHKLKMKLVEAEYTFDGSKLIFYFTANGRVDFRNLVKDLASVFRIRIELRQIGVRDEAKMLGGLGACGRPICCDSFLGDFQPVSIKMAKEQNLSLNPTKISGQCGRLMCCLKYEQDFYDSIIKRLPRVGKEILTPDGVGVLTDIGVIKERVKVRMHQSDDSYDVREYSVHEVCKVGETLPERMEEPEETDEEALAGFFDEEPTEAPKPAYTRPPRNRPQENRSRGDRDKGEQEEGKEEQPARRRYPRPKGPKTSTEQFLKNQQHESPAEGAPEEKKPGEGRRRDRRRRHGGPKENNNPEKTTPET